MKADIVVDLAFGDSGKGRVTYDLLKSGNYDLCVRWSGGANCGHTIYNNGKKIVTHLIPAGVFFGIKSIIAPGCAVNIKSFFEEIEYLNKNGINCNNILKIASNAHIVTNKHLEEDSTDTVIGTTRRGIGPCFRDKYARVGIRAEEIPELKDFVIDFHEEIFNNPKTEILLEGAQGFYLDPIMGDYPFVTSSHCTVGGAIINGIPHTAIRDVYGVCKAYDTYVGAKKFEPEDPIFTKIREVGSEFGATTGRPRQCNYLNISALKKAVAVNAVSHLIMNKVDILKEVGVWKVLVNNEVLDLKTEEVFLEYIMESFKDILNIKFNYSPL